MAVFSDLVEGVAGVSADAALMYTFSFGAMGAALAIGGLIILKKVGRRANDLQILVMSITAFVAAWVCYGKYKELLVLANGVATGPIYEKIALLFLLCLPMALLLSLIFCRPIKSS